MRVSEWGGPAFFGPLAASCLTKRIASVTRIAKSEAEILSPLKTAGIDLFVQDREIAQIRVVHPNTSVDERHIPPGLFSDKTMQGKRLSLLLKFFTEPMPVFGKSLLTNR
jgi:hypothetical protein